MSAPSAANPILSVVIVTYNATQHIGACLASLGESTLPGVEIIVSDNDSSDGTVALVRERFPQVRIVQGSNDGYGAGNNRGICMSRGRYVVVLNDDTIAPLGALGAMVAFIEAHPDVGMLGPRLLNTDGTLQPSITNDPSVWKDIARLGLPRAFFHNTARRRLWLQALTRLWPGMALGRYDVHEITRNVDAVKGACLLVRREVIDQVGAFDERFFLHTEESDWAYRIRRAGWRVVFFSGAHIVHLGGSTIGNDDREVPGRRFIQKHKSNLYFFEKHRGRIYALAYRIALTGALATRILLASVRLILPFAGPVTDLAREREAYIATARVLWSTGFARRNVFLDITFKHF